MRATSFVFWCIALCLAALVPTLTANIGVFDDYLQQRAAEAKAAALDAFVPNPEEVTNDFNLVVNRFVDRFNSSRRELRKVTGPCEATNPIDRCWRCRKNWQKNRKTLARCAKGFGRKTTGGMAGKIYVVTDPTDSDVVNPKPGTLRYAVTRDEPLWIIFSKSMIITLEQELLVTSHKTLDGRGANVHIAYGAGISIQFVKNIIIHGLHIHDIIPTEGGKIRDGAKHIGIRTKADGDGISIYSSSNIWIDHVSMSFCQDGLIDAIMGSTAITISNSHFTHHNDVMLFGASEGHTDDKMMQITVAFNHFGRGLVQRMPRCRWGFFHVVNNDYTHWLMYAIGGSSGPTVISQGNRFIAPMNEATKEITHRHTDKSIWKNWIWKSQGDLMMNGAFFTESGPAFNRKKYGKELIKAKPGTFVTRLTRHSGALNCKPKKKC